MVAGKDLGEFPEGSRSALTYRRVQSIMLNEAASDAVTGSYFDAIGKLGVAAAAYAKNFPGKTTTDTAAA
jgi:hypothetical protein